MNSLNVTCFLNSRDLQKQKLFSYDIVAVNLLYYRLDTGPDPEGMAGNLWEGKGVRGAEGAEEVLNGVGVSPR